MRAAAPATGLRVRSCATALVLLIAAGAAVAGPGDASDPLQRLLADKGLVAAAAASSALTTTTTTTMATRPSTVAAPMPSTDSPGLLRQAHDRAAEAVLSAMNYLGVHYRRGGTSARTGFDCSGFTRFVFENSLGLVLPRRAEERAKAPGFLAVRREDLQPGDLVFFKTMRRTFSHVGIYIGDRRFIHAPSRGKDVRTDDLSLAYWAKRFTGARRADVLADPSSAAADASAALESPPR